MKRLLTLLVLVSLFLSAFSAEGLSQLKPSNGDLLTSQYSTFVYPGTSVNKFNVVDYILARLIIPSSISERIIGWYSMSMLRYGVEEVFSIYVYVVFPKDYSSVGEITRTLAKSRDVEASFSYYNGNALGKVKAPWIYSSTPGVPSRGETFFVLQITKYIPTFAVIYLNIKDRFIRSSLEEDFEFWLKTRPWDEFLGWLADKG